MVLSKLQKKELISDLEDRIKKSKAIVFTNYQGMNVVALNELRKELKAKGIDFKVVKNTLVRKVLNNNKIEFEDTILDKPAALAFSYNDEVEPNKIVYGFKKKNEKFEILGAVVNGKYFDVKGVKTLAMLPSREELYAKVVGSIAAPISGFVNVMAGNLRGLVSVLKQYQEKKSQ